MAELALPALLIAVRTMVGGTLLVAAVAKLRAGRARFLDAVLGYDILAPSVASVVAVVLPRLELGLGVLLIAGLGVQVAAPIAVTTIVIFGGAIATSLLRGRSNPCGCGSGIRPVQWSLVRRNAVLAAGAGLIAGLGPGAWSVDAALAITDAGLALTAPVAMAALLVSELFLSERARSRKSLIMAEEASG